MNFLLQILSVDVKSLGVFLRFFIGILLELLFKLLFKIVGLQTQMELVDVLSDSDCFHFFALDVVKIGVIFRTVCTHTLNENFVD